MKIKNRVYRKLLSGLLLVMVVLSLLPAQALAYKMDIRNPYSDAMQVAVVDYEDQAGTWRCHGWFAVNPMSTRRINMPSATSKSTIYLFVKTSEASWGGEGIASSVVRTVNSNAFSYYDGESCPAGPNRRQEFFAKYQLEDGFLYWSPE
ncbi:MAG: DUF1036 domain-containing protein [Negativicutes bacterium]|nr:DUF1036 domain-containing protein [Negativicutes bacterium]